MAVASPRPEAVVCGMNTPRFRLFAPTLALLMLPLNLACQTANPKTVAQEMAASLRRNAATHPLTALGMTLEKPEDEFMGPFFNRMKAAGMESVTGMPAAQLLFAVRGYYVTRRPVSAVQRADYLARLDRIDRGVIDAFSPSSSSNTGIPSLVAGALAFHDFLFDGPQWKKGNPEVALVRWRSIPSEARSSWEQAAKEASVGDPSFAPWSLLAVEPLFQGGMFQLKLFNEALPLAAESLKTTR